MRLHLIVIELFAVVVIAGVAQADVPELVARCSTGISEETTRRVFDTLNVPLHDEGCAFDSVRTDKNVLRATWTHEGTPLPPVVVVVRECMKVPPPGDGEFVVDVPHALVNSCPQVEQIAKRLTPLLVVETPAGESALGGTASKALLRGGQVLVSVLLVWLCVVGWVNRRRILAARQAWGAVLIIAAVALVARLSVTATLSNWYAEVLPSHGPPEWMRFGVVSFAIESLLRSASIWGERSLLALQIGLGTLACVLLFGALRELHSSLMLAVGAGLLLAILPFHVRVSASVSDHVISSTLTLAVWCAWLAAVRQRSWSLLVLALLLLPAAAMTRVDCVPQLALIPFWTLLRDRGERDVPLMGGRRCLFYVLFALVFAGTVAIAYRWIVIPSHHPQPTRSDLWVALKESLKQFWILARQPPRWIPMTLVGAAIIGIVAMAKERPWLLMRTLVTVVAGFALLGRGLLHDELVSSRYFLFPLAVAMVLPACGVEFVVTRIRLAARPKQVLAAAMWTVVLSSSVLVSKAAYSRQYAFQDEYSFLRKALHGLPDGCVVYQLNVRSDDLERDVDCCLDVPRTPLTVVYPKLQFRHLRPGDLTGGLDFGAACVAYYESAACSIDVAQSAEPQWVGAMNHFRSECPKVHALGTLKPESQATVSPVSTNGFFERKAPTVTLYRWTK